MTLLLLLLLGIVLALKKEDFSSQWETAKLQCNSQKSLSLWKTRVFFIVTTLEEKLSYMLIPHYWYTLFNVQLIENEMLTDKLRRSRAHTCTD